MSTSREFDRIASAWLADGPNELADRVLDAALDEVHMTHQRRAVRGPWRAIWMSAQFRFAAAVIAAVAVGLVALNLPRISGVGGPTTPSPTMSATPLPSVAPATASTFDTSTIPQEFALSMKLLLPNDWRVLHGDIRGAFSLVHVGDPPGDTAQWWGPDVWLVDGALVHDPADVVSDQPARADKSRFVAWPADYLAYLTGLPGVTVVRGPEPVTIGGVTGTELIAQTPPMHPTVWLRDDTSWMGGGKTGVNPVSKVHIITLDVAGQKLYLGFADDPKMFGEHDALVQAIFRTISFGS